MNSTQLQPSTKPTGSPRRSSPFPKLDRRTWTIIGVTTALGFTAMVCMVALLFAIYFAQPRIAAGVRVAGIVVGGETTDAARIELQKSFANGTITLTDNDRRWQVPASELGVALDINTTLQAAEDAAANAVINPFYQIDFDQAQAKLAAMSVEINIPAQDGNPPTVGRSLDVPFLLNRLRVDPNGELADGILDLNMIEVETQQVGNDVEDEYTGVLTQHTVAAGEELGLIAKRYNVSTADVIALNNLENPDLLFVGQVLTIPAAGIYEPDAEDAPPPSMNTGRAIVVSTENQRIYAYENGQLVRSHLVSTGLPDTPTVKGDFAIQYKFLTDDMQGPDYFLPQVPYTMYFYQGYAIHGTYWHNAFGRPMSHGCVNLPVSEAQWFFEFAEVGTPVRVV